MSGASDIPEGVNVPGWFRRYLEVRAASGGAETAAPTPPPPVAAVPAPPHVAFNFSTLCKDFTDLGGKPFMGTETYVEARAWLRETERIFGLIGLEDARRVQLAAWQLKGEAAFWWETVEHVEFDWAEFRVRFERKFLSRAEEDIQLERFIHLKQGDMTIRDYISRFNELSRFALGMVDTPYKKASRFVVGLNEPLQGMLSSHIPMGATYEALVEMALRSTATRREAPEQEATKTENEGKKKWWNAKKEKKKAAAAAVAQGVQKGQVAKTVKCHKCGGMGHYANNCKSGGVDMKGKCYICSQPGHISRTCPQRNSQGSGAALAQVQALEATPAVPERGRRVTMEGEISITSFPSFDLV